IGQPAGPMLELALDSRARWIELIESMGLPHFATGSLHVAYREDEEEVAREFADRAPELGYACEWLDAEAALARSSAINPRGFRGALWSATELSVAPREVATWLPRYLAERYGVRFHFGCAVTAIDLPTIHVGGARLDADAAIVCSGDDFATLYSGALRSCGI